ncbi:GntR family transcriptional regulator [Clostridium sp. AN503]|uniref:FadR/GntR family transcriptional regulator n=1 Tax=Clostridium sp. AN503 TaxID=3160598 RepID=UPI003459720A
MALKALDKQSVPEQIFEMLKNEIIVGEYTVGDKLPSETELCRTLNASRVSVRTALHKLSVLGVIETRLGDGNYVKEFDFKEYIDNVGELIIEDSDVTDMAEYRTETEYICALLAMERASAEELKELYELGAHVDQTFQHKNLSENIASDLKFHYKLCRLSGNKIFRLGYQAFGARMYSGAALHLRRKHQMEQELFTGQSHTKIVQSIMDKDKVLCRQLIEEHFRVS